MSMLELECGIC